jgi:Tol biopolymer transport system component
MSQDDFDRSLDRWFEAEARLTAPAHVLDRALAATGRRRPRSGLYASLGSHWIGDGVGSIPATGSFTGVRASMALLLLTLVLALAAGAVMVGSRPVQPTPDDLGIFAPVAGRIAFEAEDDIWGVDPSAPVDSAAKVLLTSEGGIPLGWSSDGTKLLIMRGSKSEAHLFVLHADGSEVQVTERPMSIAGATISPDGSRVVFAGGIGSARSALLYAVDARGGAKHVLLSSQYGVRQPTFSPDGTRIAYTSGEGDHSHHVWVIAADGGEPVDIVDNERTAGVGHVQGLAWSPSGERIALALAGSIYTFAPDGSEFTHIAGGDTTCDPSDPCAVKLPKSAGSPYWSPDGSLIAYTTGCIQGAGAASRRGCQLAIADADGSNVRRVLTATSGPWHPAPTASEEGPTAPPDDPTATPSPDAARIGGEVIGFGRRETAPGWDLVATDPETGEARTIVATDGLVDCPERSSCRNYVRHAEWSGDGHHVAFQISHFSLDGPQLGPCGPTVGIWVASGSVGPRQVTSPCTATPFRGVREAWAWSRDGARLAVNAVGGPSAELFVLDVSDGSRTLLAKDFAALSALAWSPDGTEVAFVDGASLYKVAADGGGPTLLADSFTDVIDISWSSDGTKILIHDQGRYRIQVMNGNGSDLRVVLEDEDACCSTAWSPAGDRILFMLSVGQSDELLSGVFDSQVWTVSSDGSDAVKSSTPPSATRGAPTRYQCGRPAGPRSPTRAATCG